MAALPHIVGSQTLAAHAQFPLPSSSPETCRQSDFKKKKKERKENLESRFTLSNKMALSALSEQK